MTDDAIPLCIVQGVIAVLIIMIVTLTLTSLNAVSRSRVKSWVNDAPDNRNRRLYKLLEKPSRYRFTDHIIRTLVFAVGYYAVIQLPAEKFYFCYIYIFIYTLCMIIFGDMIPTKIAKAHCEHLSLRLSGFQKFLCIILSPLIFIAESIADLFLRLFKQDTDVDKAEFSEDDIMSLLEAGEKSGELKEESKKLIDSIFKFDDKCAYEIMTPRPDVFMIDINGPKEDYFDELMSMRYSRIPVYEDEYDNIIGILNIKDYLIKARKVGFGEVNIRSILRDALFVPETKKIDSLFTEMQKEKQHISILIDEYGGFSGIATMEDIIEEIVGDIDDEFDEEDDVIDKIGDNVYLVDGSVSLDDLNEATGSDLESETSETIGGFVIDQMGEIPEDGYINKNVDYERYTFTVISVSGRRIERLKMTINKAGDTDE